MLSVSMNIKKLFVISRYNEDCSWIHEYTTDYLIYNKGVPIDDPHVLNVPNLGRDIRTIFQFNYDFYDILPELIVYVQANPFDHCRKDIFDSLIHNESFTNLESNERIPITPGSNKRDTNGGFIEFNCGKPVGDCVYSMDQLMNKYYQNYTHLEWVRFAPGAQYIVEKHRILYYSRDFWRRLMDELPDIKRCEGHMFERMMMMIFECRYLSRF